MRSTPISRRGRSGCNNRLTAGFPYRVAAFTQPCDDGIGRMSKGVVDALQWYGAAAGALAALIVSLDLGRRWTGIGFVIFVTSSIALVTWGFLSDKAQGI